jgi:hypothetical protein
MIFRTKGHLSMLVPFHAPPPQIPVTHCASVLSTVVTNIPLTQVPGVDYSPPQDISSQGKSLVLLAAGLAARLAGTMH